MSLWRSGSAGGRRVDPNLKSRSCAASQRHAQVIDIMHTHLGAGAAMVQPFFFCASDHSTEPGHALNRLWLVAHRGGLGLRAAEFIETPTFHLRVEHFQGSAAGVDLIVMREI